MGVYLQNAAQWTPWFRSLIGVRGDFYDFDVESTIPRELGQHDDSIVSPKLSLDLRAVGQDRVLRELRLRLSQQRRAGHHDHGRSEPAAIR